MTPCGCTLLHHCPEMRDLLTRLGQEYAHRHWSEEHGIDVDSPDRLEAAYQAVVEHHRAAREHAHAALPAHEWVDRKPRPPWWDRYRYCVYCGVSEPAAKHFGWDKCAPARENAERPRGPADTSGHGTADRVGEHEYDPLTSFGSARARCSCGWESEVVRTAWGARRDHDAHLASVRTAQATP